MKEKISGIYMIQCINNNKIYIGQSIDIYKRWGEHKRKLSANSHENIYLRNTFNKYGIESLAFSIIEECSIELLDEKEKYYILNNKSNNRKYGYNLESGGSLGKNVSEETKTRIKNTLSGRRFPHMYNGKTVICDGIEFKSLISCARYYNENEVSMLGWINGNLYCPQKYINMNLKYKNEELKLKDIKENKNLTRIICEDTEFDSIKRCAEFYKVKEQMMTKWLKGESPVPKIFKEMNLSYVNKETKLRDSKKIEKRVICENLTFDNMKECCEFYDEKYRRMLSWINGNSICKEYYHENGLRYENEEQNTRIDRKPSLKNTQPVYCVELKTYFKSLNNFKNFIESNFKEKITIYKIKKAIETEESIFGYHIKLKNKEGGI